ncbi:MAG: PQQ-dependent dehydrogenase, methanol/ethanol family [Pseudomonadota bacterium]
MTRTIRGKARLAPARLALGLALTAALVAGASAAGPKAPDWSQLLATAQNDGNWITYGGTYDEQRFSRLTDINERNVTALAPAWSYEFDTNRAQETTPLIYEGVLYATSAWSKVFAFDVLTGKLLWSYDPEVPRDRANAGCCDVGNRGVAMYDGKLYLGTFDGRLVSLDAKTGKPVWSVQTTDVTKPYTITGAPRVVKGKVIIGNGGAELGVRGYVSAYDAQTGKKIWRFYTVPGNPANGPDGEASDEVLAGKAAGTWNGTFWQAGGGGTVWDSIVYDTELDQLYIGVGNGSPWNHRVRSAGKGDNLFLSSVVALNPDTGKYIWHYQGTPAETWDFTHTQTITLATLNIGGAPRKVLMQAPKNGFFFVIDRVTGKLISADNYVPTTWATGYDQSTGRPIETPEARYGNAAFTSFPGALGGHNWQPMAYSPLTGLAYIPAQDAPFRYEETPYYKYRPGGWNLGIDLAGAVPPDDVAQFKAIRAMLKGRLIAWDPVQQKEVWRHDYTGPWNGGVLVTAGNLVFQGDLTGKFHAFTADKGKQLWSYDLGMSVMGSPVTFKVGGDQYVAVVSGYGGAYALTSSFTDNPGPQPNGRLTVFKLGGKAVLAQVQRASLSPANPASDRFAPAQVASGKVDYENQCFSCHGPSGMSSGVLPDLRRSAAVSDRGLWKQIVHGGLLKDNGMVSFARVFSEDEVESIRAYVSHRAEILKREEGAK